MTESSDHPPASEPTVSTFSTIAPHGRPDSKDTISASTIPHPNGLSTSTVITNIDEPTPMIVHQGEPKTLNQVDAIIHAQQGQEDAAPQYQQEEQQRNDHQPMEEDEGHEEDPNQGEEEDMTMTTQGDPVETRPAVEATLPLKEEGDEADALSSSSENDEDGEDAMTTTQRIEQEYSNMPSATQCRWKDCHQILHSLAALVIHLSDDHIGWKKDSYACEWQGCSRKPVAQSNRFALISHMRSHTKHKPYDCPVPECDKSFSRSDAMAKHLKVQHGDVPERFTGKKSRRRYTMKNPAASSTLLPSTTTTGASSSSSGHHLGSRKRRHQESKSDDNAEEDTAAASGRLKPIKLRKLGSGRYDLEEQERRSTSREQRRLADSLLAHHLKQTTASLAAYGRKSSRGANGGATAAVNSARQQKLLERDSDVESDASDDDEDHRAHQGPSPQKQGRARQSQQQQQNPKSRSLRRYSHFHIGSEDDDLEDDLDGDDSDDFAGDENGDGPSAKERYGIMKAKFRYIHNERESLEAEYEDMKRKLVRLRVERELLLDALAKSAKERGLFPDQGALEDIEDSD